MFCFNSKCQARKTSNYKLSSKRINNTVNINGIDQWNANFLKENLFNKKKTFHLSTKIKFECKSSFGKSWLRSFLVKSSFLVLDVQRIVHQYGNLFIYLSMIWTPTQDVEFIQRSQITRLVSTRTFFELNQIYRSTFK